MKWREKEDMNELGRVGGGAISDSDFFRSRGDRGMTI